jgi:hypothetical protein
MLRYGMGWDRAWWEHERLARFPLSQQEVFCWAAAVKMHTVGVGAVLKLSLCETSILKFALILTI